MLKKARKNLPLNHWEKKFNKIIDRTNYKVDRTFGSIRRWFGKAVTRYNGIEKMHTQNEQADSVLSFATVFMSFNAPDLQIGKYCHPKGTVLTLAQPKTKNFRLIPRRPQNITYVLLHLGGYKKSDVCTLYPLLVRKVDQNHLGQTL